MEILLVEDSLVDARLAIANLTSSGTKCRVTLVRDGDEAMAFLRREGPFGRVPRPDLILLDLELPRRSGREVLREIKEDFELARLPVVIMTASVAEEDRSASELLHVDGYMTKPVDFPQFLQLVRRLKTRWLADVILPALD
jgi:CheY-like chemotaxis protein